MRVRLALGIPYLLSPKRRVVILIHKKLRKLASRMVELKGSTLRARSSINSAKAV
jgi:hypothetical protein